MKWGFNQGKFYKFWSSETKDGKFSMSYYESGNERGKSWVRKWYDDC